jgi:alkylhydroperoxidase family enzyme
MQARLDYGKAAPAAMKAMLAFHRYGMNCGLEPTLLELVKQHFSEEKLVNLVTNIIIINSWNRLSITLRTVPGTYQP